MQVRHTSELRAADWDRLTSSARERIIEYLSPVVGDETYPRTNWLWFRVAVETFLSSVGGPWPRADIDEDLALHDSFYRWAVVLSELSGTRGVPAARSVAELSCHDGTLTAALRGPDGAATVSRLTEPRIVPFESAMSDGPATGPEQV